MVLPGLQRSAVLENVTEKPDVSQAPDRKTGTQVSWSPYDDNGGSTFAMVGKDFVLVAGDTRMSSGYSILSRDVSKCAVLPGNSMLVSAGMQADRDYLIKVIRHKLNWYEYDCKKKPNANSISQMVANILYSRRYFPLYTWNILVGFDEKDDPALYSFDIVGCLQKHNFKAYGAAEAMMQPMADMYIDRLNMQGRENMLESCTVEDAIELVTNMFEAATERQITTGVILLLGL